MSTRPNSPALHRLTFVSARNQDLVAEYLAHLRTRHASPKTLQTTLGALVTFSRLLPPARQPSLWQDVTRLTPADVDAWLEAAQRHGLAPSTIHTTLSVVRRFCTLGFEEHLAENIRLGSEERFNERVFCFENSSLESCSSLNATGELCTVA